MEGDQKKKGPLKEQPELLICHKCGKELAPDEVCHHPIRGGYSSAHFPLFHFEKVPLCAECLERQRKLDIFEKILALTALAVVLYFMGIGLLYLFSPLL